MHSAQRARTQRPIRKQTGNQKQKCVSGQKVIRQRVGSSKRNDNPDQSNHGQTNAYHGGRDGENVDADILLQMRVAVPVRFSFHGEPVIRPIAKPTVQTITALIGNPQDVTGVAFEIH